jgi:hypothetical protein
MFDSKSQKQLAAIQEVASRVGRGVHKRIDENREMLELLQKSAPNVLEQFPGSKAGCGGMMTSLPSWQR